MSIVFRTWSYDGKFKIAMKKAFKACDNICAHTNHINRREIGAIRNFIADMYSTFRDLKNENTELMGDNWHDKFRFSEKICKQREIIIKMGGNPDFEHICLEADSICKSQAEKDNLSQ